MENEGERLKSSHRSSEGDSGEEMMGEILGRILGGNLWGECLGRISGDNLWGDLGKDYLICF